MYNLKPQFGLFQDFLDILQVPWLRKPGIEADDFIATLAWMTAVPTVVVSADHDLLQLVTDTVSVLKPAHGQTPEKLYTPELVYAEYGLHPKQLPEMWALMGDAGDGIDGIPQIGPVRATAMITEHGDLDRALAYDPRCDGHERLVYENLSLIWLDGSVAREHIPVLLSGTFTPGYPDALRAFFLEFEMNTLVRKFDQKTLWKEER